MKMSGEFEKPVESGEQQKCAEVVDANLSDQENAELWKLMMGSMEAEAAELDADLMAEEWEGEESDLLDEYVAEDETVDEEEKQLDEQIAALQLQLLAAKMLQAIQDGQDSDEEVEN